MRRAMAVTILLAGCGLAPVTAPNESSESSENIEIDAVVDDVERKVRRAFEGPDEGDAEEEAK